MVSRSGEMRTVPKQNISSAVKKLSEVLNKIERQCFSDGGEDVTKLRHNKTNKNVKKKKKKMFRASECVDLLPVTLLTTSGSH